LVVISILNDTDQSGLEAVIYITGLKFSQMRYFFEIMESTKDQIKKNRSRWGLVGAVAAAIGASICCVVPFVLLAVGIGGAWVGSLSALAPYRPIFIIASLGLLGYAFYRIYRKPKAEECEPGSYCAVPQSNRINKIVLWLVTVLILGLLAFPYVMPHLTVANDAEQGVISQQVTLKVNGMTCAGCVATVTKSLEQLDGVNQAQVTLEPPQAIVTFDSTKVSIDEMIDATTKAGYQTEIYDEKK